MEYRQRDKLRAAEILPGWLNARPMSKKERLKVWAAALDREGDRQHPCHRGPVLQHVGDPRGAAQIVFQDVNLPVAMPHQVGAGDVTPDAAGRIEAHALLAKGLVVRQRLQPFELVQVVRGDQNRAVGSPELPHHLAKPLGPERIEPVGGLIQHEQLALGEHRLRQPQPLEGALGELLDQLAPVLGESGELDGGFDPRLRGATQPS